MRKRDKQDGELDSLREIFDFSNPNLLCFGISAEKARAILKSLEQFSGKNNYSTKTNGPDLAAEYNDTAIAVELFQYDASLSTSNGSKETKELNTAEKIFYNKVKQDIENGITESQFKTHRIRACSNRETFTGNFLRSIDKHKSKIDAYKKNVIGIKKMGQSECWFLAEDCCSISPIFQYQNGKDTPRFCTVLPPMYSWVANSLVATDIDGLIIMSDYPISNYVVFIKNDKENYRNLAKFFHFTDSTPVEFSNGGFAAFSAIPITKSDFEP